MKNTKRKFDYIHLPQGTLLKNSYKIIKRISDRSNMSIVYLARNQNKRKVVIKEFFPKNLVLRDLDGKNVVYKSSLLKDKFNREKKLFLNEIKIMKKFSKNKYIANCYEAFSDNNTVYLVMKYYKGSNLEYYLQNNNIEYDTFYQKIFFPLLDIVYHIHKKGYIHRDLKPSNIIIYKDKPLLIDFGSTVNYKNKKNYKILMTPGYSPIEFYSAKSKQGPYSDIYSLAAILYYYLTDEVPLEARERIIKDDLKTVKQLNNEVSLSLNNLIMRNLSLK